MESDLSAVDLRMSGSLAVEARALSKRFGERFALRDFSLTIQRGAVVGLLGPNGAGKTTTIKILLGLTHATSGTAQVLGARVGDREARRRIGYLPELFRYYEWLSARETLDLHGQLLGLALPERRTAARAVLERVGLAARADDRVAGFSKGMQQRLGLGVALLGSPELVFLDEPTSALDPMGRHDVRLIIEHLRSQGTTVILNSHLLTEVERVCDHLVIVDRGTLVASGSVDMLLGVGRVLRLRLGPDGPDVVPALRRYGTITHEGSELVVTGVEESTVPSIVAELIALGAQIFGVEIVRVSLEERFLEILGDSRRAESTSDHRLPDVA